MNNFGKGEEEDFETVCEVNKKMVEQTPALMVIGQRGVGSDGRAEDVSQQATTYLASTRAAQPDFDHFPSLILVRAYLDDGVALSESVLLINARRRVSLDAVRSDGGGRRSMATQLIGGWFAFGAA